MSCEKIQNRISLNSIKIEGTNARNFESISQMFTEVASSRFIWFKKTMNIQ